MPLLWGPGAGGGIGTAQPSILFQSACGDATLGTQEWTTLSGTVTVDGTVAAPAGHTGPCQIKCDSGSTNVLANIRKAGILGNAAGGRRINLWIKFSGLPTANADILAAWNAANTSTSFRVFLLTTGVLRITTGAVNTDGTTVLAANTRYRICVSFNITSTTVHTIKVYLATDANPTGALEVQETNQGTLSSAAPDILRLGWTGAVPGASLQTYIDDVTVDDLTDQSDMGDVRETYKAPTSVNTNTFDTVVGTGAVNERPLSATNGRSQLANAVVTCNFNIQGTSAGDVDLTGATIVGYTGWIWASGVSTDRITLNGVNTVVPLATTASYQSTTVTSSTYPTNAAGIGVDRPTGSNTDLVWSEGGVLVAFRPGAAAAPALGFDTPGWQENPPRRFVHVPY